MGGSAKWRNRVVWTNDENGKKVPLRDANGKIVKVGVRDYSKEEKDKLKKANHMNSKTKNEVKNLLTSKDDNFLKHLDQAGFRRWTKHGRDRLYINASTLGASTDLWRKTYIDLKDGTVHSEDDSLAEAATKLLRSNFKEFQSAQRQAKRQSANSSNNNAAYSNFMNMTDDEKASAIITSVGQKGDITRLPQPLQKGGESRVQKVVHDLGLHDKPTVLSTAEFNKYMKDNHLTNKDLMTRSADNPNTFNAFRTSDYNYIAGRKGGSAYGEGTYFDHSNGHNTGYGTWSMNAVLNPQTAKVVKYNDLSKIKAKFSPALQKAVGNQEALIALAAGYNVIEVSNGYTVVIDRSAVIAEDRLF